MKTFLTFLVVGTVFGVGLWVALPDRSDITRDASSADKKIAGSEKKELQPLDLVDYTITLSDGKREEIRIPSGFETVIAAQNLGKARFMAKSPDGRIFLPDLVDYQLSREGRILILEDFNERTKKFEVQHTYLSGLRGPNSVAFYTDESGQTWIYIALTEKLVRYPYTAGDIQPSGEAETVTTFPNRQSPNAASVVWHITRTLLFVDDTLFVSIGSGCNACEQPVGEQRGAVLAMDPDGDNKRVYAGGLRNAVGLERANEKLYATENGVDHLGADAPDDLLYALSEGEHYGWPYCYEQKGEKRADNSVAWERKLLTCEDVPHSVVGFEPHSAPLGITFFANAHEKLAGAFLVALHGSFEPELRSGYEIVRVTLEGKSEIFMDGFQRTDGSRWARPVDILQESENSFFFTDDLGGRMFYVYTK